MYADAPLKSPARLRWWPAALIVLVLALGLFGCTPADQVNTTPVPADDVAGEIVDTTVQTAETTADIFQSFLERLIQTPRSDVARVLLIIGGVVLLVAGWRISDFVILIAGFLVGAAIGLSLVTTDTALIAVAALLVGGLIGAALAAFVYYVAVFVIGAYFGIALTGGLAGMLALTPVSSIALLIGGLIGGLVLIGLSFEFLVILSALVGAQMLALGFGLNVVWLLVLAALGIVVQLFLVRRTHYEFRHRRVRLYRRHVE